MDDQNKKQQDINSSLPALDDEMQKFMFKESPVGFALCELDGTLTVVNQAYVDILGCTEEEVRKLTYWDITPIKYEKQEAEQLESLKKTGRYGPYEKEYIHKDGHFVPILLSGIIVKDQHGIERIWSVVQDISYQKESQQQLAEERDRAKAATKAKGEFLANMSHEIRTPMNGLIGMSNLLLETSLSEEQQDLAATVKNSAESLLVIINDILDFSKIEAGKLELNVGVFNLQRMIKEIQTLYLAELESKSIALEIDVAENIPDTLFADPSRIRQVLLNLLSNAVKFTPPKGSISLKVANISQSANRIVLYFVLSDTGVGISIDRQEDIFNAFSQEDSTTSRRFGGTGLGLSISKHLVNLMGGKISVESEKNKGSRFTFTIPCKIETEDSLETTSIDSDQDKLHISKLNILLVEDNHINQKLAAKILEKEGHEVIIADNGAAAVDLFKQQSFDLILMDIQMPEMSGEDATVKIRTHEKEAGTRVPIIAVTAHAMEGSREKYLELGMDGYVSKPLSKESLLTEIYNLTKKEFNQ